MGKKNAGICTGLLRRCQKIRGAVSFECANASSGISKKTVDHINGKFLSAEKTVLISILSASAAAGRVVFASVPSVQAASFVIILSGVVFGHGIGLMTGVITAIISNMVLGHGPWTVWQMLCWGLMGYTAGLFSTVMKKNKTVRVLFGFLWGYIFGFITNIWILLTYGYTEINIIIGVYAASFIFDTMHGLSNAFLIFFCGDRFIKIFDRISLKYGINYKN